MRRLTGAPTPASLHRCELTYTTATNRIRVGYYLKAVSQEPEKILHDPSAPLHRIVRSQALEELLVSNRATPWYGQLMTTPQTVAYFLQLNYWLKKYKVKIVK